MKNVICYKIILLFLTFVLHIGQLLKLPFLSQVLQIAICLQSTYKMFGMFSKHTQHYLLLWIVSMWLLVVL